MRLYLFCMGILIGTLSYSQQSFTKRAFRNWEANQPSPENEVAFTVWLAGEMGAAVPEETPVGLSLLMEQLGEAGKESAVIFLGNQISGNQGWEAELELLKKRIQDLKSFKGKIYFLSGNKEWKLGGIENLAKLEEGVEAFLDKGNTWVPNTGCGTPKVVELNDWITLVLIDSQWYYDLEYPIEKVKGCSIDNREEFKERLEIILDEYNNTDILIATHHPMMSGGNYGGYTSWKDHFLPFPIVGSAIAGLKTIGLNRQYLAHPRQRAFADMVMSKTAQVGHIIFAAGHDQGLQYTKEVPGFTITGVVKSDRHFIISGGLAEGGYIRKQADVDFGYKGKGFTRLKYLKNGEIWMEMWGAGPSGGTLLFRQQLKERDLLVKQAPAALEEYPDSVTAVADSFYAAGKSQRTVMGTMYRDVWTTPLKLPVLDLATFKGGLVPIKKGGGIQSKSLRLEDSTGQQYVIRSVKKDISLLIPKSATQTFLQDIAQDALSMSHPYGAWVVPPLAQAAGVYHTRPTYFYVPEQPALGDFNGLFGNQFYLFEQRPKEPDEGPAGPHFGNAEEINSTFSMLRERWDKAKERPDAEAFLRARLFDNIIGDWDRHEDQWRWAEFDQDSITLHRPIPRDRDQVFLTIDGILPWIISREWGARMFQNYDADIRDIQGQNLNARFIDRLLLTGLDREKWVMTARFLQENLTDEVLEEGFDKWPQALLDLNGDDIMGKFKARRANLVEIAERYYGVLAREIEVVGTNDEDRFLVERLNNNQTRVRVYGYDKKQDRTFLTFDRMILGSETREIRLFGLKGDDRFELRGQVPEGIKIRIIGGPGEDSIQDQSQVRSGKKTLVYDLKEGTHLEGGPSTRDLRENSLDVNTYVYKSFKPNSYLPLVYPGWNLDDGPTLGGSITFTNHGFRKEPFKSKHFLGADIAFATGSFGINYVGDFTDAIGKWDFHLESRVSTPRFVVNFFGLGNETEYTDAFDEDFDINRVRIRQVTLKPALKRTFNQGIHQITVGPTFQYSKVEETEGRFVSTEASGLNGEDFEAKNYGGVDLTYELDARDNSIATRRGYRLRIHSGWNVNLQERDQNFSRVEGELSLFHYAKVPLPVILATRIGYLGNFGDYEFFQAASLGRSQNLRGYRRERFSGDQALFHNTEIRLPIGRTQNYFLPIEIGLIGFFDYGRVWFEGEDSDTWHTGYGGGVILSPFASGVFTLTYETSEEFNTLAFRLGFLF